ncbi:DUF4832 domain-containing protein [Gemmatimonadota bacterium]
MAKLSRHKIFSILAFSALAISFVIGFLYASSDYPVSDDSYYKEDYNWDGYINIADVITVLLMARKDPGDPRIDYNADGEYSINDVVLLLLNILRGNLTPLKPLVVEPAEIDSTLINPGRGFATSFNFNEDVENILYPECSIARFSWYWDELEPEEGRINFSYIDSLIERARDNSQTINFRVICQNGRIGVPGWLIDAGAEGQIYPDSTSWQPYYDDPIFLAKHEALIKALADRYDGHPGINYIDIGSLGRWGEWHTSNTGVEMPSEEIQQEYIDMYFDNFMNTPLVMQIAPPSALAYAVSRGSGWRADCLGDLGGISDEWNHMEDLYQQALDAAGADSAWIQAPVVFETCWTMQLWYEQNWDIDYILSEALRWHVSVMNNKSESIPEEWWPKVVEFEKKMGYRFVLRRLEHPVRVGPGNVMSCRMEWENKGVAPCYLDFRLAFEFRDIEKGTGWVVETGSDITGWMPGTTSLFSNIKVPQEIVPGDYDLGLAILNPHTGKPGIRLAIAGSDEDGWYMLSRITIH